jgi:hypothetical protein
MWCSQKLTRNRGRSVNNLLVLDPARECVANMLTTPAVCPYIGSVLEFFHVSQVAVIERIGDRRGAERAATTSRGVKRLYPDNLRCIARSNWIRASGPTTRRRVKSERLPPTWQTITPRGGREVLNKINRSADTLQLAKQWSTGTFSGPSNPEEENDLCTDLP